VASTGTTEQQAMSGGVVVVVAIVVVVVVVVTYCSTLHAQLTSLSHSESQADSSIIMVLFP
jgi:hypothetical protein